ncbi:hypothetical protein PV10_06151 [Exophiala mesophila]|uniref:Pentatricopeptide repeat protein n=1 Tax=Exophiala mesophila TaxID=212818 RepID=A0A0D1WR91_EXOME|nr:uncharacterized protein PV10_06151 [Exophiala mesophila]KIV91635.1 hypothetical protein PV10_06151 [Exophiala mesophila]
MGSLPQFLTKPSPVPSKAALRVLRQIALSPLTLTVGGLCGGYGVTLLDFETRRKIHSAQTALENKRILRSITHGRGEAYVQAMFEAAERGDDLTLFKKNYPKTHARPLTSLAHLVQEDPSEDPSEDVPVSSSEEHSTQSRPQQQSPVSTRQKLLHNFVPATTRANPQPQRPIIRQHYSAHGTKRLSSPRDANLLHHIPKGSRGHGHFLPESKRPGLSLPLSFPYRRSRKTYETTSPISTHVSLPPYRPFNELGGHLSPDDQPTPATEAAPWLSTNPKKLPLVECSDYMREIFDTDRNYSIESFSAEHILSSQPQLRQKLLLTSSNAEDLALITTFIFGDKHSTALSAALRWMSVLEHFVNRGTDLDFDLAEGWFFEYRGYFPFAMACTPPVLQIVERRLSSDDKLQGGAKFLYPRHFAHSLWGKSRELHTHALAIAYLEYFAQKTPDYTAQGLELDKIILLADISHVPLNDELLAPMLNSLVDDKRTEQAHRLLHAVEKRYGFEISQQSLELLAMSYATEEAWSRASEVIHEMHVRNYSRTVPTRFQAFFARILEYRGRHDSAEHCIIYAMDHVRASGLVVCSDVSRVIVCIALRDGRHELIAEWERFVEHLFLRVDVSYSQYHIVTDIVRVWEELGISCAEIASACRAMAIGAREDPFGPFMRSSVWKLLRKDLMFRLEPLLKSSTTKYDLNAIPTASLIQLAEKICHRAESGDEAAPLRQIKVQLEAIADLKQTFKGENSHDPFDSETFRRKSPDYHEYRRFKPRISSPDDWVPTPSERVPTTTISIDKALAEHYAKTGRKSEETHSLLKSIVRKLTLSCRTTQAIRLLERVYNSKHVQGQYGTPYDEELFSEWLSLAYMYGSEGSGITALWAIIDSYRHLNFSQHLFMLMDQAHRSETRRKVGMGSAHIAGAGGPELRHLRGRLNVLQSAKSRADDGPVGFEDWQSWEQRLRQPPSKDMEFLTL